MKIFRFVVLLLFFIISLFVNAYLVYKGDAKHQLHDFYWYSYLILYLSFSFVILFVTDIFYKLNVFYSLFFGCCTGGLLSFIALLLTDIIFRGVDAYNNLEVLALISNTLLMGWYYFSYFVLFIRCSGKLVIK